MKEHTNRATYITASILKPYNPGLYNRNDSNAAKTVIVGGTERVMVSSQCLKRELRQYLDSTQIRSAHLEDLVDIYLKALVESGEIDGKDVDKIAEKICECINANWGKRASKNTKGKDDAEKGRVTVVADPDELNAIFKTVVSAFKSGTDKDLEKTVKAALQNCRIKSDKAMFGTFASDGYIETMDGALQVAHSYSIDAYAHDSDDWHATFAGAKLDEADPFFGSLNVFVDAEQKQTRSQGMGTVDLYSNTLFSHIVLNLHEYCDNLTSRGTEDDIANYKAVAEKDVPKLFEALAVCEPSAKQRSSASHVAPAVYYLEVIENGRPLTPYFEKLINAKPDESITEQGIKHIADFAADEAYRTGTIHKYVILNKEHQALRSIFEKAGVTILHSLNELNEVVRKAVAE